MHWAEVQQFFKKNPLKHSPSNDLLIVKYNSESPILLFSHQQCKLEFSLLSPTVGYHLLAVCGTGHTASSHFVYNQTSSAPQGLQANMIRQTTTSVNFSHHLLKKCLLLFWNSVLNTVKKKYIYMHIHLCLDKAEEAGLESKTLFFLLLFLKRHTV